jgi:hypothetical protein
MIKNVKYLTKEETMTTFLRTNARSLVIDAVVAPLTIYGLHRIFPAPNVGFLAIASAVALCTHTTIAALGRDYAQRLTTQYNRKDGLFHRIYTLPLLSLSVLLPIFAKYAGQRMEIQVPGYLQTAGYVCVASIASQTVKTLYEILECVYYSYYPKIAIK